MKGDVYFKRIKVTIVADVAVMVLLCSAVIL
jgi:hypothetical protein